MFGYKQMGSCLHVFVLFCFVFPTHRKMEDRFLPLDVSVAQRFIKILSNLGAWCFL